MKTKIQQILNAYEENNPETRELNDIASEDLFIKDKAHPSRPPALQIGYFLDGGLNNRQLFGENYNHLLHEDEKDVLDEDVLDLAELSALLHHPEYIVDASGDEYLTENRQLARDLLEHLKDDKEVERELYLPLLNLFLERVHNKEALLNAVLPEIMTKRTEHHPKTYSDLLKLNFVLPVAEGHLNEHWNKFFKERRNKDA